MHLSLVQWGAKYAIKPPRPRSNYPSGALRSKITRCLTDELIFSFGRPGGRGSHFDVASV